MLPALADRVMWGTPRRERLDRCGPRPPRTHVRRPPRSGPL